MESELDEAKSEWNLGERGIGIDFAARALDSEFTEYEDTRRSYGETRYVAIGPIDGTPFVVVYTWRDGRRRIISARRADRRERDAYRRTLT